MTMITADQPVRLEVKFFGGPGFRRRFTTLAEATQWLASDEFTAIEPRVRNISVTVPHPVFPADPEHATPRPRKALPPYLTHGLPRSMTA